MICPHCGNHVETEKVVNLFDVTGAVANGNPTFVLAANNGASVVNAIQNPTLLTAANCAAPSQVIYVKFP